MVSLRVWQRARIIHLLFSFRAFHLGKTRIVFLEGIFARKEFPETHACLFLMVKVRYLH